MKSLTKRLGRQVTYSRVVVSALVLGAATLAVHSLPELVRYLRLRSM